MNFEIILINKVSFGYKHYLYILIFNSNNNNRNNNNNNHNNNNICSVNFSINFFKLSISLRQELLCSSYTSFLVRGITIRGLLSLFPISE